MFGEEFARSERVEVLISDELTPDQRHFLTVPQLCKRGRVSCNMVFLDKSRVIDLYRDYTILSNGHKKTLHLGTSDVVVWLVFLFRVERQKDERR